MLLFVCVKMIVFQYSSDQVLVMQKKEMEEKLPEILISK